MPQFSQRSKDALYTCDERLIRVMERAIVIVPPELDFTVLEGHRGKEKQDEYFKNGTSTLKWPRSNHNREPSLAVDIVPYPIDWGDRERFGMLATYIYRAALIEKVYNIRWGGHWRRFQDLPHWELTDG